MKLKQALIAVAVSTAGCGTSPTVMDTGSDPYPGAGEALLDEANCPDADPDGEGLLHDPVDGTRGAVLSARAADGRMYTRCRESFLGLVEHERERLREDR